MIRSEAEWDRKIFFRPIRLIGFFYKSGSLFLKMKEGLGEYFFSRHIAYSSSMHISFLNIAIVVFINRIIIILHNKANKVYEIYLNEGILVL